MLDAATLRTPKVRRAYQYWLSKSVGGRLPSRSDIKPRELVDLLDQLFLVEVTPEPLTFTFRLVGTKLTKWAGLEYTGLAFSARTVAPNWEDVFDTFCRVVKTRLPRRDGQRAPWANKEFYWIEQMVAPLSNDGKSVDMLFGAIEVLKQGMERTPFDRLTARERDILLLLVAGKPNKVIALKLSIGERTVEAHRSQIMIKMKAGSLAELIRLALAAGVKLHPDSGS